LHILKIELITYVYPKNIQQIKDQLKAGLELWVICVFHLRKGRQGRRNLASCSHYMTPCSIIASATFWKPAMLAPAIMFPS